MVREWNYKRELLVRIDGRDQGIYLHAPKPAVGEILIMKSGCYRVTQVAIDLVQEPPVVIVEVEP